MKFIFTLSVSLFSLVCMGQKPYLDVLSKFYNPALKPFYHGVASGDPTPEAVVIWTKLTPETEAAASIHWQIASDSLFLTVLQQGNVTTSANENWTVSVDVHGLEPNHFYFYRFDYQGKMSMVGRTKTTPVGDVQQMKIAVVSCSNYEAGYFNAYAMLARHADVDLVLHLGDYIYEYQVGGYGNKKLPRKHIPAKEIVALDDYRARYAQYRLDPDLQLIHARFPFINVWDDHEFANDAYVEGAQNHQEKAEGEWSERKNAARKAYFEWIPVRKSAGNKLYRQFSFGNLADLWMLDERMEARTKQSASAEDLDFNAENRHMIGDEQFTWLTNGMQQSKARWRILGNQVILSSLDNSKVFPKNPKFMDMWDGYPAERNRLFRFFEGQNMKNIVVVTGDCHTSWVMDLTRAPQDPTQYDKKTGKGIVGIEFTTPSITSANYDEYVKPFLVKIAQRRFTKKGTNPHVRFMDLMHHGYLVLTLSQESVQGEWFFMKHINRPERSEKRAKVWVYPAPKHE
jgi:alkaline phosphatase D